jgi:hypothetical protein
MASVISLPPKPMQNSVIASVPGSMPKPTTATRMMVQIISCTERLPMMNKRLNGYSTRRSGVMLKEANHDSGTASSRPTTVATYDIWKVSTMAFRKSGFSTWSMSGGQ